MKDYLTLRDEWYDKLKESGFEDIEDTHSPREMLKCWHSHYFAARYVPVSFELHQAYFQMADSFRAQHKFNNPFERNIWECHSEGLSQREIAKLIDSNQTAVFKVTSSLSAHMKVGV